MKNLAYFLLLGFLFLGINLPAFAGPGRTGAQILNLGGGARAAAMGDAFTAINGDVTTAFWNPAGLATIQEIQETYSYTDYSQLFGEASEGLYYAFLAGALPLRNLGDKGATDFGVIGGTLQLQGQGTILVTTDSPEPIREEKLGTNWALTGFYADRLSSRLLAGISGKVIQMKLGPESGSAYAADLGIQYHLLNLSRNKTEEQDDFPNLRFVLGTALRNVGTRIKFKDENQSDPLPCMLSTGLLWSMRLKMQDLFPDTNAPRHFSLLKINLTGDLTAFIDKLKEDDEEGIDAFLAENPGVTRDDLLSDRGVGIHAFEWKNMQKSIGAEIWLLDMLALRLGYKDDPGINLPEFADNLSVGLGLRLPISSLFLFASGSSPQEGFFQELYGETNRQIFLAADFAWVPGGGPNNDRLSVFMVSLGF